MDLDVVHEIALKRKSIPRDERRMYRRILRTVDQYSAPDISQFSIDVQLKNYRAAPDGDEFLRTVHAPLLRGCSALLGAVAPLVNTLTRANALDRTELPEVAALFSATARLAAAFARTIARAGDAAADDAAAFERTAREIVRMSSALSDSTDQKPMRERVNMRNGQLVYVLARADAEDKDDTGDTAALQVARFTMFIVLASIWVSVMVALGVGAKLATDRAASEKLVQLEVALTGTTTDDTVWAWAKAWYSTNNALDLPSTEVGNVESLQAAAGAARGLINVFDGGRNTLAFVVAQKLRGTGASVAVQALAAEFFYPIAYDFSVGMLVAFGGLVTTGGLALIWRQTVGASRLYLLVQGGIAVYLVTSAAAAGGVYLRTIAL